MNLLSFLLSLLFSFVAPATTTSLSVDSQDGKITKRDTDGGKKDKKFNGGDFIIVSDTTP